MKKILFVLISALFLASCGQKTPQDIINPDAEYRYFFGASCPHCQELNRIAESRDLWSKIPVEKREIYMNAENRDMFLELTKEIGADGAGVPFVYDTISGEYAVGVKPALELMTARLNKSPSNTSQEATETSTGSSATGATN
jgi:Zn ribbon nucleic-acid-binding protein